MLGEPTNLTVKNENERVTLDQLTAVIALEYAKADNMKSIPRAAP